MMTFVGYIIKIIMPKRVPVRVWIWILLFLSRYMTQLIRVNFRYTKYFMVSEALTQRFRAPCLSQEHGHARMASSNMVPWRNLTTHDYGPRFNWTNSELGTIGTMYHTGFIFACIFVGFLIELVGPYSVLLGSIIIGAYLNVLRVIMAHIHWKALAALEFFVGFDMGLSVPSLFNWMARWSPPHERAIFVCAFLGNELAEMAMGLNRSYLVPLIGWQCNYYFCSSQVILIFLLHKFLGSGVPETHPFVTAQELQFIQKSLADEVTQTKSVPPYRRILASVAFWGLAFVNLGFACSRILHMVIVPEYLHEYIGQPYSKAPYMEFMPYIGFKLIAVVACLTASKIQNKRAIKNSNMVRVYLLFSHFIPACLMSCLVLAGCNTATVLKMLTISFSFMGFAYISAHLSLLQISPNFVGTIYGLAQIPAHAISVGLHKYSDRFWHHPMVPSSWPKVLISGSLMVILPTALFLKNGDTKCQKWNKKPEDQKTAEEGNERKDPPKPRVNKKAAEEVYGKVNPPKPPSKMLSKPSNLRRTPSVTSTHSAYHSHSLGKPLEKSGPPPTLRKEPVKTPTRLSSNKSNEKSKPVVTRHGIDKRKDEENTDSEAFRAGTSRASQDSNTDSYRSLW